MSEAEAGTSSGPKVNPTKLSDPPCHPHLTALPFQDRPEPRGRKPNEYLPPSRAREVQRAFRLRRAEHLAVLEERITNLESENSQLRAMHALPETDRGKIGSGPTGRGKSLREGGVPMSERVRARKEARARERHARGLPEADSSEASDRGRDSTTLSPRASDTSHPPFFSNPAQDASAPFNYQLPMPFNLPVSPGSQFPDFSNNLEQALYKPAGSTTPGFSGMFSLFDTPSSGSHLAPSHSASLCLRPAGPVDPPQSMLPPLRLARRPRPGPPHLRHSPLPIFLMPIQRRPSGPWNGQRRGLPAPRGQLEGAQGPARSGRRGGWREQDQYGQDGRRAGMSRRTLEGNERRLDPVQV